MSRIKVRAKKQRKLVRKSFQADERMSCLLEVLKNLLGMTSEASVVRFVLQKFMEIITYHKEGMQLHLVDTTGKEPTVIIPFPFPDK